MSVTSFSLFDDAKIGLFLDMDKYFERKVLNFNAFCIFCSIIFRELNKLRLSKLMKSLEEINIGRLRI